LQQVGSYLGYTGGDADIVAEAAPDPELPFDDQFCCDGWQGLRSTVW
jgi:hypothetical protein